jgi:hypothetical protein
VTAPTTWKKSREKEECGVGSCSLAEAEQGWGKALAVASQLHWASISQPNSNVLQTCDAIPNPNLLPTSKSRGRDQ